MFSVEQKQLDEIDESYFGDEFIEDDFIKVEPIRKEDEIEEIKIESVEDTSSSVDNVEVKPKKRTRKTKASKVTEIKADDKEGDKLNNNVGLSNDNKEDLADDKVEVKDKEETVKESIKANESVKVREPIEVEETKTVDPDRDIKTNNVSNLGKSSETSPSDKSDNKSNVDFNPWDDKSNSEKGMFMEASTWKAITGIAIILLVFSIFTQGFQFSDNGDGLTGAVTGQEITVNQAEEKVLSYVNTQLLQPPFVAEVVKTSESNNLFLLTLSIAGEEIDSYLTKNGRLFFPQGFDLSNSVVEETNTEESQLDDLPEVVVQVDDEEMNNDANENVAEGNDVSEDSEIVIVGDDTNDDTLEPVVDELEVDNSEVNEPEPVVDVTGSKKVSITAKRWLFSPHEFTVNKGDTISLTINPQDLDFTFSIAELGVEKEVSGTTVVEFVANKEGSFEFTCSSCEEWRGMTGTLTVK